MDLTAGIPGSIPFGITVVWIACLLWVGEMRKWSAKRVTGFYIRGTTKNEQEVCNSLKQLPLWSFEPLINTNI